MKVIKTAKLKLKLSFLKTLLQFKSGLIRYYRWLNLINPTLADPHYQLGNLLVEQKDWQAGINCYQQAIDLHHPELSRVYYSLGNALKKLRRFESA
ncbi:tetratricopeptide repeat protein, partial [Nostoc sp.]